ncbi:tRNA(Ile)-lysidine synthetase, partial [Mycobacterium sp. ITM-2017-0098]
ALDDTAAQILADLGGGDLPIATLVPLPAAVRRRVIRGWLLAGGACALTDKQIRAVDALVTDWRGQGGVAVPGGLTRERLFAGRR